MPHVTHILRKIFVYTVSGPSADNCVRRSLVFHRSSAVWDLPTFLPQGQISWIKNYTTNHFIFYGHIVTMKKIVGDWSFIQVFCGFSRGIFKRIPPSAL